MGVFLLAAAVALIVFTGGIKYLGIFENADIPVIFLLLGGFVVQGAVEEFLCRGIVLHSLKEKTSLKTAVGISTLMFIVPHLSSLFAGKTVYGVIGAINLVLISVILSLLTVRFESIWADCGLHSFWNFALYGILGLNLSGKDEAVTAVFNMQSVGENILNGGEYGIEASIVTMAVLAGRAVLIRFVGRKK